MYFVVLGKITTSNKMYFKLTDKLSHKNTRLLDYVSGLYSRLNTTQVVTLKFY